VIALATAAILLAAVAGAFALERAFSPPEDEPGRTVSIVEGSKVLRTFTMDQLQDLGVRRVVMQGKPETGPSLLSVLSASGVTSFSSVTVIGLGVRDSGRLTLMRKAVDNDVLLDIAKRGTSKICGPDIPYARRVRDVTRVEVQR
jgi:hypothetical protein